MTRRMELRLCAVPAPGSWLHFCCLAFVALLVAPVLSASGGSAFAQSDARVEARLSADSVKVGERFTLTLVAEHAGGDVLFPSVEGGPASSDDLELLRRGPVQQRQTPEGRRVDSVAYEVAAFAADSARVPVFPVRFVTGGDTTVAGTPPRLIPIISVVPADAEALRTPAALAPFPWPPWVWAILAVTVLAALGGAYTWWQREQDAHADEQEADTKSPYEAASARLQHLERRHPNDRSSCKAFYIDLTETLRVYLAKRLQVRALECTTRELIERLEYHPTVPDAAARRLKAVLEQADLVKFADARPAAEESQDVLKQARGVLDALEAAKRRAEARTTEEAPASTTT